MLFLFISESRNDRLKVISIIPKLNFYELTIEKDISKLSEIPKILKTI